MIVGTIVAERENVAGYLRDVGLPVLLFCLVSLTLGLLRAAGAGRRASGRRSPAPSRSACTTAPWRSRSPISVLGSVELAVPAAVYGVLMFPVAAVFGWAITRLRPAGRTVGCRDPAGA